ncbi:hypothetical protein D3C76_1788600 [compost metagenome]
MYLLQLLLKLLDPNFLLQCSFLGPFLRFQMLELFLIQHQFRLFTLLLQLLTQPGPLVLPFGDLPAMLLLQS